jgi:hypothetical protein
VFQALKDTGVAGSSTGVLLMTAGTQLSIDFRFFLAIWWYSLGGNGGGVDENLWVMDCRFSLRLSLRRLLLSQANARQPATAMIPPTAEPVAMPMDLDLD